MSGILPSTHAPITLQSSGIGTQLSPGLEISLHAFLQQLFAKPKHLVVPVLFAGTECVGPGAILGKQLHPQLILGFGLGFGAFGRDGDKPKPKPK